MPYRRKKDHGRAEAMLILAWGLGIRIPKTTLTAKQLAGAEPLTSSSSEFTGSGPEEEAEEAANVSSNSMRVLVDDIEGDVGTYDDVKQELLLLRA